MVILEDLLKEFIDIQTERYHDKLTSSMAAVCSDFGFERGYLYYLCEDPIFMKIACQWSQQGIPQKRVQIVEEVSFELPWLMRELKNNHVISLENMSLLPSEAFMEREGFQLEGVTSCLILPLFFDGNIVGFLGFENLTKETRVEPGTIDSLQIIGQIWSSAYTRINREEYYKQIISGQSMLLDNSEAQLWSLKNTTVYHNVNDAHAKFFGKKKEEMEHHDLYDIFPNHLANRLSEDYWSLFQGGDTFEKVVELTNYLGEERILLIKSRAKKDGNGNIDDLICTAEDITAERKAKNEVIQAKIAAESANLMKSQFLANMSHEIRTPLNGIIGFLNLLLETDTTNKQQDYISSARTASEILLYLINDILDFSKIEAGKMVIEKTDLMVRSVVESVLSVLHQKAMEKNISLHFQIDERIPRILRGDPKRLNQILNNLVSNAVKFTEEGHVFTTVDCVEEKEREIILRFVIKDTGIGISEKDMEKLFQPFIQADASTTRKFGGTGLGLAITKELVNLMNGEIRAESQIGLGSSFIFTLVFEKQEDVKECKSENMSSDSMESGTALMDIGFNPKLLLVEDNEMNRKLFRIMLKNKGLTCDVAVNGLEAVEALKVNDYDIVFMDCQMPVMDGYESTERIRIMEGEAKHTMIIAMTANSMEGDREKCISAGMDEYISKPIDFDLLFKMIRDYLLKKED